MRVFNIECLKLVFIVHPSFLRRNPEKNPTIYTYNTYWIFCRFSNFKNRSKKRKHFFKQNTKLKDAKPV